MGLFTIPPPDKPIPRWHISALVDLTSYSFSWVWVLVPLVLLGPDRWDYMFWYLFILAMTDVHRHFNFPYVYADSEVRKQYPLRFWLFPALMAAAWGASPWLASQRIYLTTADVAAGLAVLVVVLQVLKRDGSARAGPPSDVAWALLPPALLATSASFLPVGPFEEIDGGWWWFGAALYSATFLDYQAMKGKVQAGEPVKTRFLSAGFILLFMVVAVVFGEAIDGTQPRGGFRARLILNTVAVFAGLWNFWHVYMQKYGIMRMYNAKSGNEKKVPGWVDRLLIFSWLPLFFAWLGPMYREVAMKSWKRASHALPPLIDFLETIAVVTVPVSIAIVTGAVVLWVVHERRANGFRNWPRIWFALGTTGLSASFLLFDPVKAYLAFAFSHAIEYMVFVWAFKRRRYHKPLAHRPFIAKIISRPVLAYFGFIIVLSAIFLYLKYWGRYISPESELPQFLDYNTAVWLAYWGIYQSMVHFYFDGFLWKMRLKSVRANI